MQNTPISLSILILDDSNMLTVASVIDPLRAANRLSAEQLFEWEIFSPKGDPVKLTGNIEMKSQGAFSRAKPGDYLIVIASFNQEAHACLLYTSPSPRDRG